MSQTLTRQQYYDLCVCYALDGTFPATKESALHGKMCAYRGVNGARCVAGVLMPDEKYHSDMEGNSCTEDDIAKALEDSIPDGMKLDDVRRMQSCHDAMMDCWYPEQLIRRMNELDCFADCKRVLGPFDPFNV